MRILRRLVPLLIPLLLLVLEGAGVFSRLEAAFTDLRFLLRGRLADSGRVAVVGIDSDDLEREGAINSWGRDKHALLLSLLERMGAKAAGVDLFFLERETRAFHPSLLAETGRALFTLADLARIFPDPNALLAGVLRGKMPVCLAHIMDFSDNGEWQGVPGFPGRYSIATNRFAEDVYAAAGIKVPVTTILTNTPLLGFAHLEPDVDGAVRRLPLLYRNRDRLFVSLGLGTALGGLGLGVSAVSLASRTRLRLGRGRNAIDIPVNPKGEVLLNWLGPQEGSIPFISWSAVNYLGYNYLLEALKKAAAAHPDLMLDRERFLALPAVVRAARMYSRTALSGSGSVLRMVYDQFFVAGTFQQVIDTDPTMDFATFLKKMELDDRALAGMQMSREQCRTNFLAIKYGTLLVKAAPGSDPGKSRRIEDRIFFELVRRNVREFGMGEDSWPYYLFPPRRPARTDDYLFPSFFKGKTVVYGLTAAGTQDFRAMPFQSAYPMVGAWATLIDSIYTRRFLQEAGPAANLLWFILFTALALVFFHFLEGRRLIVAGLALLMLHTALGVLAFTVLGTLLHLVAPTLCLLVLFVHRGLVGYLHESGEKRRVRAAFSLYLNPGLVDQVISHPELLRLGGEKKEVTVFFSDIEGFTALSEGLDPGDLVTLLNRYLTAVTDIILEEQGMLDKYEGDAVMAVFGAPLELTDHAERACRAAVRIQKRLVLMAEAGEFPRLRTRIGLNSGTVVAGNMGSTQRFDYTVMGDAVNLGSRLEGANKLYGSSILVSGATRERAGDAFLFRELDLIRVVGRQEPVRVFELRGMAEAAVGEEEERIGAFARGLELFRARRLEEAEQVFRGLGDTPSRLYLERIALVRDNPDAFSGDVFTLTSK